MCRTSIKLASSLANVVFPAPDVPTTTIRFSVSALDIKGVTRNALPCSCMLSVLKSIYGIE